MTIFSVFPFIRLLPTNTQEISDIFMQNSPLISIYLPTHNRVTNLKRAVASIQAQQYSHWQLIIINDGSKDGTKKYLEELQAKDPKITVIQHDVALGACAARNAAINIAAGEFITGLDDDDEFSPDRLSYFLDNWSSEYTSLCTPVTICKNNQQTPHPFFIGELNLRDLLVINKVGNQLFCKTEDLKIIGGFDETFKAWQDYDTWVRFFKQHGEGLKLPHSTYLQYEEQSESSITRSPNRLIGFNQFVKKHKAIMSNKQRNAMRCWQAIITAKWVPINLLIRSDSAIFNYALRHNIKKLLGR